MRDAQDSQVNKMYHLGDVDFERALADHHMLIGMLTITCSIRDHCSNVIVFLAAFILFDF